MLHSADDLLYRFRTTMASSDADDAQESLAQVVRDAAERLEYTNPDTDADFSKGVDWAVAKLRALADEIANRPA